MMATDKGRWDVSRDEVVAEMAKRDVLDGKEDEVPKHVRTWREQLSRVHNGQKI